jgi:hypothetical protein
MQIIKIILLLGLFALLPFQNCGQQMSSLMSSQDQNSIQSNDQIYLSENETLISKVFNVSLWTDLPEFTVYLVKREDTASQSFRTFIRLSGFTGDKVFYDIEKESLQDYSLFIPRIYEVNSDTGRSSEIYLQNDAGTKLLSVSLNMSPPALVLKWEIYLPQTVSSQDLLDSQRIITGPAGSIRIGKNEVSWVGENSPTATIVSSCLSTQHLENGLCIDNIRSCPIANGRGQQIWINGMWSPVCAVSSCNSGYAVTSGVCAIVAAVPTCTATQHLENNLCMSNTRSCLVQNGVGQQQWVNNSWSTTCTATMCNSGYGLLGGACVAASTTPTCMPNQRLENNVCVDSALACANPKVNIVGMAPGYQITTGTYYSPETGIIRLNGNRVGNVILNTATKLSLIDNELHAYGQGIFSLSSQYRHAISWNLSQSLTSLAKSVELSTVRDKDFMSSRVTGAAKYGTDVYVSGVHNNKDGKQFPRYWKNGVYYPLPLPPGKLTHFTSGLAITSSGDVYIIGGDIFWKNGVVQSLSSSTGLAAQANDIFSYGNDIYIAGTYVGAAGENPKAVYWKNGQRIELTDGKTASKAVSIKVVKGTVYVGVLEGATRPYSFSYWKGAQKYNFSLTSGYSFTDIGGVDMEIMNDDVYIMGNVGASALPGYFKNGLFTQIADLKKEDNSPSKPTLYDMLLTCP